MSALHTYYDCGRKGGMSALHTYYDCGGPACFLPEDGLARVIVFDKPQPVEAIGRAVIGELIYVRRLTPEELESSGLIPKAEEERS